MKILVPFLSMLLSGNMAVFADDGEALVSQGDLLSQTHAKEARALIGSFTEGARRDAGFSSKETGSFYDDSRQKGIAKKPFNLPNKGAGACGSKDSSQPGNCKSSLIQWPGVRHQASGITGQESSQEVNNNDRDGSAVSLTPDSRFLISERASTRPATLLIFVSSSMPSASIQALWQEAHKIGGRVVFRGLIGGTFQETQQYIKTLGIAADIDPVKFDAYRVIDVPTFVVSKKGKDGQERFDKVSGHISLREALDCLRSYGDLREDAKGFLDKIKGHRP